MKTARWLNLVLVLIFLSACTGGIGSPTATSLATAPVAVTHTPNAENALRTYLDAMLVEDYATMYSLITQASRAAITQDNFAKRYTDDLNALGASSIEYSLLSVLTDPTNSQVAFRIIYHTALLGDIQRDFNATLVLENGQWLLPWDDGLILPELAGGKYLYTNYESPARGDIYDRNGNAIVTTTDAYALGLIAGDVSPDNEDDVFHLLSQLTGVSSSVIRYNYENYSPGNYVPVGEASVEEVKNSGILHYSGVDFYAYNSRFYVPDIAPHAVGYTLFIGPDQVNYYRRLGYSGAERVGFEGIEKWGEAFLHGKNGATVYIMNSDNTSQGVLAQANTQPASSIYLTINNDLQARAQDAMDGLPGAIVVMEVKTGRILAMVSSPGYDPNLFDTNNYNRNLSDVPDTFNRATQGKYPLGSVFKIITMSAALDSKVFTPESTFDCMYTFTDIIGHTLYDWTYDRCQTQKLNNGSDTCPSWPPSGMLTLPEGLMRSCDPWFYHISYELWKQDKGNLISDMANAFGLGHATGIQQVAESEGTIPYPTDGLDATSIGIGQGKVLVTPLQVARFIAAVGNGGTLYRPQLVEKVQPVTGDPTSVFKPEATGTLPISPENLKVIQDAMISVVKNERGTAYSRLGNFSIPTAAKTGTAESGATDPHAWFAGYSLANKSDKPDIAVVVVVNNQGEGSVWAAPIFRRVMEIYFFGRPQTVYPWETTFGSVNPDYGAPQPTQEPDTPTPQP
jgi:cell division protein FtsI/penicillin-binding protein 2